MFLKSSFSFPRVSAFVAFDGGGAVEVDARRVVAKAPLVVARKPEPAPLLPAGAAIELPGVWREAPSWRAASGLRVRRVEAAVIVAICAYFAFGLARLAGAI